MLSSFKAVYLFCSEMNHFYSFSEGRRLGRALDASA
jgi:hypothetical protein